MMKFYKTVLVHLKHIFYGKYMYAYILMSWGAMGWLVGPIKTLIRRHILQHVIYVFYGTYIA